MLNENDFNLLDGYLDDALSPTEVQRLDGRFSSEPELSDMLKTLREERAARVAAFSLGVPSAAQADAFAARIVQTVRRRNLRRRLASMSRLASALAAMLVIGFGVGWFGRGHSASPSTQVMTSQRPPAAHSEAHLAMRLPTPVEPGQYQVAVLDENGEIIAVERFTKIEDARAFANDLAQYEVRRQQVQERRAMLVSDRF